MFIRHLGRNYFLGTWAPDRLNISTDRIERLTRLLNKRKFTETYDHEIGMDSWHLCAVALYERLYEGIANRRNMQFKMNRMFFAFFVFLYLTTSSVVPPSCPDSEIIPSSNYDSLRNSNAGGSLSA